ncbi:glycosyltransferase [Erythrobacter sp. YT30]|uniref:glycosyltransferase n=1 Tax=Erythrobacter sp. YT30 TaxID=1735012 RepID=UPI0012E3F50C|nr:glycosyltransferase [Erythrobacter sp. YT30]
MHNLNDAAVERRCRMLSAGGADVALAGFCRDAEMGVAARGRGALMLGQSHDAALAARAAMTLKNAVSNSALRDHFAACDAIMARNLEQLAIAARIADGRPLIYECLDIHRALLGDSLPARIIQWIEQKLLQRSDLLITSSPAFIRNHFASREIGGEIVLVENKLLLDPIGSAVESVEPADTDRPITIGWFGMLRCKRTLEFLTQLITRSEGRVKVLIAGKPSPAELPNLEAEAARCEGITFTGPYTYDDLPQLYGQCDFAWSIDWFEEGLNSKWLLPNRIYEAIAHGAIPIALADVEVGHWLKRHDAGLVVRDAEEAAERILSVAPSELAQMRQAIDKIERDTVICSLEECRDLVRTIEGLSVR